MPIELNSIELRVLGVLIEKSMTQQAAYPLTLNAILLGANQKQNRDPVMETTESQIAAAIYSLQQKQLVAQAAPVAGARANRFAHNVVERLHWDRREQAVMAELMLRGAQTSGELRSRAGRMTSFPDLESITATLGELSETEPPCVTELPREPGKSANRFRHLLADVAPGGVETLEVPADAVPADRADAIAELTERLARLEAQVARLTEIVDNPDGNKHDCVDGPAPAPI